MVRIYAHWTQSTVRHYIASYGTRPGRSFLRLLCTGMARGAEALRVVHIPEQRRIATVWDLVVGYHALFCTLPHFWQVNRSPEQDDLPKLGPLAGVIPPAPRSERIAACGLEPWCSPCVYPMQLRRAWGCVTGVPQPAHEMPCYQNLIHRHQILQHPQLDPMRELGGARLWVPVILSENPSQLDRLSPDLGFVLHHCAIGKPHSLGI